jgi:transcriptional regulator with XRE-family HTH domain
VSNKAISLAFGRIVRARRFTAGLTQEQLAERAAIHPTYVGLIERAQRNATLDVAARIAQALGASLAELVAAAERSGRVSQRKGGKGR